MCGPLSPISGPPAGGPDTECDRNRSRPTHTTPALLRQYSPTDLLQVDRTSPARMSPPGGGRWFRLPTLLVEAVFRRGRRARWVAVPPAADDAWSAQPQCAASAARRGQRAAVVRDGGSQQVSPDRNAPFGARLRRLREATGLTQEELATRAGMSAKGISDLERGADPTRTRCAHSRKRCSCPTPNALA
jgi:DNA-binding XRE family transcriptional regulator